MCNTKRIRARVPRIAFMPRLCVVLAAIIVTWLIPSAHAAQKVDCSPANGVSFICGVTNVEDFAPVPNTKWVIGSDLSTANAPQGNLYLFDTASAPSRQFSHPKSPSSPTRRLIPTAPAQST